LAKAAGPVLKLAYIRLEGQGDGEGMASFPMFKKERSSLFFRSINCLNSRLRKYLQFFSFEIYWNKKIFFVCITGNSTYIKMVLFFLYMSSALG